MKTSSETHRHDLPLARTHGEIIAARTRLETTGFAAMDTLLDSALVMELRAEALGRKKEAVPTRSASPCRYQAHLAGLGESGRSFLTGNGIAELLDSLFDISLLPEEGASCYTYYQAGDFLDPHLDHAESCRVTVIVYLDVVRSAEISDETGLELHILGDDRCHGDSPRLVLPTKAGSLIIGLGSVYWHRRPELQKGESVAALTACYSERPPS